MARDGVLPRDFFLRKLHELIDSLSMMFTANGKRQKGLLSADYTLM